MKISFVIAALSATVIATPAMAGGFSFSSKGGNFGKWAYGDASAHGSAEGISGYGKGAKGKTKSFTETYSYKGYNEVGGWASSQQTSTFSGKGGKVSASSSAVHGSGIGYGSGFKKGSFSNYGGGYGR